MVNRIDQNTEGKRACPQEHTTIQVCTVYNSRQTCISHTDLQRPRYQSPMLPKDKYRRGDISLDWNF